MKKFKKIFMTCLLCLLVSIVTVPASVSAAAKLNQKSITLNVKKSYTLKVTGTKEKVTWTTSNKKVATVSAKGVVKAVKKGTATITAKYVKKKLACKVTVKQPVTSVKLNNGTVTLTTGKTVALKATVLPQNANNKAVSWISSNKKVATVSSAGIVKAVGVGTATITVKAKDGSQKKASCKVTVKPAISNIELSQTSVTMIKGKSITLVANIKPNGISNKEITWTSSNPRIATVSSTGVVKGIATGTATITVKDKNNSKKKASCKITVAAPTPDNIYQVLGSEIKYTTRFDIDPGHSSGMYTYVPDFSSSYHMQLTYKEKECEGLRKSIWFSVENQNDPWGKISSLGDVGIEIYPNSNKCEITIITDGTAYETTTTRSQIRKNGTYDFKLRDGWGGPEPNVSKLNRILQTVLAMWNKVIPAKTYNSGEITIGMKDIFPNY